MTAELANVLASCDPGRMFVEAFTFYPTGDADDVGPQVTFKRAELQIPLSRCEGLLPAAIERDANLVVALNVDGEGCSCVWYDSHNNQETVVEHLDRAIEALSTARDRLSALGSL